MKMLLAAAYCVAGALISTGATSFATPPVASFGHCPGWEIDGKINAGEIKLCAGNYGFCRLGQARLFDPESKFNIGTDGDNLLISIISDCGPNGILERCRGGRAGSRVLMDDSFEFVIVPNPDADIPDIFHLTVNNKGGYMTTSRRNGANTAWEAKFNSAGLVKNGKWSYEISLPLEQFGMKKLLPEQEIGLRICRNWRGLKEGGWVQSQWSQLPGAFFESNGISRVVYRPRDPVVRVDNLVSQGKGDLKCTVFNPEQKTLQIKVNYTHRPDRSQSVTDVTTYDIAPGETKYLNLPTPQITENETVKTTLEVTSPSGGKIYFRRAFAWKLERRNVFAAAGGDSAKTAAKFAFYPETDRIFLQLDFSALSDLSKLKTITAEITGEMGGKAGNVTMPEIKDKKTEYLWQLPSMKKFTEQKNPSGKYILTFNLGSEKIVKHFERKIFAWENNKLGSGNLIIPPFTAISVRGDTVSTILRTHTMAPTGLWRQVKADGENLLADNGMYLVADFGGRKYVAVGHDLRIVQNSPANVSGSAAWRAGELSGTTDFRFDYDGMMKFGLTLNAGSAPDSLKLIVPLEAKNAYLFHACTDGLRFNYGGATPDKWNSKQAPRMDLQSSFVPYIWLGTEGRGFSVYGENDKNWTISQTIPAQTIERQNSKTVLSLNLLAKPLALREKRTITLAFQATPVKPMLPDWRKHRAAWGTSPKIRPYLNYSIAFYGSSLCSGGISDSDDLMPRDNDLTLWKTYGEIRKSGKIPPGFLDKWCAGYRNRRETYRREINYGLNVAAGRPLAITYYTNARGQRIDIPESRTFLDNWFREEFQSSRNREPAYGASLSYSVDPTPSYRDYALDCYYRMITTGAADNIYWDDVFLASNFDRSGAEDTYMIDNGKMQPSVGLFNIRELVRRTAIMQMELGRKPNNMVHMTNTAIAPICAFAQQNLDWEDNLGTNPFQQRYTREYIRAVSIGRQFGNLPAALGLVNATNTAVGKWCLRTGAGVALTHEIQWAKGSEATDYQKILFDFYKFGYGDETVKVHNYWDRAYPVIVEGGENASILLQKGNEAYLVVCSYNDDADFTARLKQFTQISAVNGETSAPLATKTNSVSFRLKKYDFIFIKIEGSSK